MHLVYSKTNLHAREKWIVNSIGDNGKIYIDDGAARALKNGKSLPAGITKVEGKFEKGDNIMIVDKMEMIVQKGLHLFIR